ncbi:MAG TPA: hypothetical protein VK635_10900 [Bradyrhizobium sp.]|nr:hypothetical protein [Bradyrhizobium sp.]
MLLIACSFGGTFVYKLRVEGIFACPATGYSPNAYLSDCTAGTYGDYDHGAFWFGLEPQAQRAAGEADVLFVGNSRLQFAFGGQATASWFSSPAIRYYLLGFSNSETVAFFGPLLSKMHPRAKVYVINVDRLFDERVSPPTEQILQGRDVLARYEEKRNWQSLHRRFCAALPAACGDAFATYRTRETGVWQMKGGGRFEPRLVSDGPPTYVERWDRYARLGEKFLAQLPVDRSCVILTIVPTVETKRAEAMALAAKLGHDLLAPQVDGLHTFDGSHLDEASAERWSAAFLREAGLRIRRCVGATQASTG